MFLSQELRDFSPRGISINHQSMPSGGEKYAGVIQMLLNKDKGVLRRIEVANMNLAPKIVEEGFQAERIHRRLKGFDALQVTSGSATLGIYNDLKTGAGFREVKLEPGSVVVMPASVIRSWEERDYIQFRLVSSPPWNQAEVRRVSLAA